MDIFSPRGEVAAMLAQQTIDALNKRHPVTFLPFLDNYPSPFDGMVAKEGKIIAAYEVRTRNAIVENNHLIYAYGKKYPELLITKSKIDKCIELTSANFLPFWLIIRFNNCTLLWAISDNKGNKLIEMRVEEKRTRKTINGGSAVRENYFIPFSKSKPI